MASASVSCPTGSVMVSGGATWVDASSGDLDLKNVYLHTSAPLSNGWYGRGIVDVGAQGSVKLRVYVRCLAPWAEVLN